VAKPTEQQLQDAYRRRLVDELGDIDVRLAKVRKDAADEAARHRPDVERYQKIEAEILTWAENELAAQPKKYEGDRFEAVASQRSNESEVIIPVAKKMLGAEAFLGCCTVTLRAIRGAGLTAVQLAKCIVTTQSGSRALEIAPKVKA
jgi:hypothetical protein